jgi:putative BNR repeat neuraminidase
MAAGGSGGFTLPIPVEATITSSPEGGWQGLTGAGAYWYNGVTYFGYIDSSGNVKINTYSDAGVLGTAFTLHATLQVDWHCNPAVLVRSDGRIIVAYCRHSGSEMYVRLSSNPEDISAFGTETNIDSQLGGFQYTYPILFESGGTLYLFYRDDGPGGNGEPSKWSYSTSTDGVTWAAETIFYNQGTLNTYMAVDFDGTRFDFAVTDGSADADNASVYHFYRVGSSYYKSDGTLISASLPLTPADLTLVHSGASGGARYPASIDGNGGSPIITWPEFTAGAKDWYYAAYSGSWTSHNVVSDGATGAAWVEGGFALDHSDPTIAWLSRSVSGHYQVFRYRTYDSGATWFSTQISASASDDFYPFVPRNAGRLKALWLRGTASSATSYTLQIMGANAY